MVRLVDAVAPTTPAAAPDQLPHRAEGPKRRFGSPAALYLGVSAFTLFAMRQTFTVPGSFGLSLAQTLFAGCALIWVLTILTGHATLIRERTILIVVLAYVTTSFLSYGAAMSRGIASVAQSAIDRYVMVDLLLLGLVLFILTVLRSVDALRTVVGGIVLGGTVSAFFAVVMVGTGIDLAAKFRLPGLKASDYVIVKNLLREGIARPQGAAGHPLELSAVLTVMIPLSLGLILEAHARRSRMVWLWIACATVLGMGAVVTVSRSAVIGTIAAVFIMSWRWPITRVAATIAGTAAVLGAGMMLKLRFIEAMIQTFLGAMTDSSIESRQVGLTYASNHFWEHPWLGQGVGAYPALKQPVLDNQYLSRLMEAGVIGAASFVAVLAIGLLFAVKASASRNRSVAELGGGISGSIAAVIVISLILDTSGFIQIWYLSWILIALAGAACHLAGSTDTNAATTAEQRAGRAAALTG